MTNAMLMLFCLVSVQKGVELVPGVQVTCGNIVQRHLCLLIIVSSLKSLLSYRRSQKNMEKKRQNVETRGEVKSISRIDITQVWKMF